MASKKNKMGYTTRVGKIYVQGSIDGVFKRYSTGLEDNKINITWIKKNHRSELERIHTEKTAPVKVSTNFVDYALKNLELNASKRKAGTVQDYKAMFESKIKPFFLNYDVKDIKRHDLMVWQDKLVKSGLAGKTINNIRTVFNYILEEARKDEIIEKNYFSLIDKIKVVKPEITPFNLDEVKLILSKSDECWQKNFVQTAFFTGMRTGELLGLKWDDINFVTKTISIKRAVREGKVGTPKTENSVREIDMLPLVEEALIKQKQLTYLRNSYVFLNYLGNHLYDSKSIRKGFWSNTLKLIGLNYRDLYQTRHTFASIMISRGEDVLWVSKTLGHSNLSTTLDKYARYVKSDKVKRATFLDGIFEDKNCTKTAQSVLQMKKAG